MRELHVTIQEGDDPAVVFVHGSMDRGAAFARVARQVRAAAPGARPPRCVRYDRPGYGRSRDVSLRTDLGGHVDDLAAVVETTARAAPPMIVGHSFGGVVALYGAARGLAGSVVVYEPPLAWLGWWPEGRQPRRPDEGTAAEWAEGFVRRMIGDDRWEALPARTRAARRAEGPALVADVEAAAGAPPLDLAAVGVPVLAVHGGASGPEARRAAEILAGAVPDGRVIGVPGVGHDGHLSAAAELAAVVHTALTVTG